MEVIIINQKKIIFYTTECPKCKVLKQKLDEKGIVYEICDNVELMTKKNIMSVPVLEVDGKIMNFNEGIKWIIAQ